MSDRRIYKYQGTLIGDDRVDDLIAQVDNKVSTDEFEKLVKVTPTDIAVKDNNKIILKHDSEEISGQTNPVEFKTINEQSLLGKGNINIDAGSTVILEAGMEVTTELVEKLKKASQIFYKVILNLSAETQTEMLLPTSIYVPSLNSTTSQLQIVVEAADLELYVVSATIKLTNKTEIGNTLPSVIDVDSGEFVINNNWIIDVLSPVRIVELNSQFTTFDFQILSHCDTLYAEMSQEEGAVVKLQYNLGAVRTDGGKISYIAFMNSGIVDPTDEQFTILIVRVGQTPLEVLSSSITTKFILQYQMNTINGKKLYNENGDGEDITTPTVQIEILEEGDN